MPKYLADGTSSRIWSWRVYRYITLDFFLCVGHYTLQREIPSATPPPISLASSDLLEVFHSRPLPLQLGTRLCHLQTDGLGSTWCTVACHL